MVSETLRSMIEAQQAGHENEPLYTVGLQLLDIAEHELASAELLERDLEIPEMSLEKAANEIKRYADEHHGRARCFCVTPKVAEEILRKFYGLPDAGGDAQPQYPVAPFVDLSDFL